MRNLVSFVSWLLGKWFVSDRGWYRSYERHVVREPLPMFFGTIFIYFGVWCLTFIPMFALDPEVTTVYTAWIIMAVVVFGNYFRILLTEQYRLFQQERQKLFKTIKGSHNV
jgi:NO-binding membrane sensor protein with MHYT domain